MFSIANRSVVAAVGATGVDFVDTREERMNRENPDLEAFSRLLRQYKKMVEENSSLGIALQDQNGQNLYGNLFEVHADLLAPVLKNGNDLQDLFAVMSDYRASYDVTGEMLPDNVLSRFVRAKSDSGKLCAESGISAGRLHKHLSEHPRTLLRFLALADASIHDAVRENINVINSMICSKRDAQAFVGLLAVTVNNGQVNLRNLSGVFDKIAAITGQKTAADVFNLVRALIIEHTPLINSETWRPVLADVCEALGTDDFLSIARFMQCGSLVRVLKDTVGCNYILLEFWNKIKGFATADPKLFTEIESALTAACFPEMTRDNFTLLCREIARILASGGSLKNLQLPFVISPPVIMADADTAPSSKEAILVRQLPAFQAFPQNARLRHVEVEWQGVRATLEHVELAKILEKHQLLASGEPSYAIIAAVFEAAKRRYPNSPEIVARVLTAETLGIRRKELVACLSHLEYSRRQHDGPPVSSEHDEYM